MTDTTPDKASRTETATTAEKRRHDAGAFDIRRIVAALIGLYGLVLGIAGLVGTSEQDLKDAGGMNINLDAGIGMLVVASVFLVWARLRPTTVPDEAEQHDNV